MGMNRTDFSITPFLEYLYETEAAAAAAPDKVSPEGWGAYQEERKGRVREILCLNRLEQAFQVPLSYELLGRERQGELSVEKYRVNRIQKLPLAVYALRGQECNGKAVMYLCGHDNRGARGAFLPGEAGRLSVGAWLAKAGYLVLIPELFAFGEAKRDGLPEECGACESCAGTEPWLLNCGMNLVGLRVFEAMKTLDFAEEAFGLHGFGCYGISGGGQICNYTGALDPRVEAVMVSGYPNLYKYSTMPIRQCTCNYVPGQLYAGESCQITGLAAPKRLLTINGDRDPVFPIEGSLEAFRYLDKLYADLGVPENYTHVLFPGGHEECPEEILKWLGSNYS